MFSEIIDLPIKLSMARKLAAIICADLIILLLLNRGNSWQQEYVGSTTSLPSELSVQAQEAPSGLPIRLTIPSLKVSAIIESVGITETGTMATPSNSSVVGWFSLGPRPGDLGSAVIAGHFNSEKNNQGVFLNLSEMRQGDQIHVENDLGETITFVVREAHTYDPGYVDDVFNWGTGSHLNLVTCDGEWDPLQKNFSKRLVVFADLLN